MEVTVLETGDLPASTVISFHTGSIRRHAQVEKNKAINLSHASSGEPIRVDLMSQVGSHTFDMVPGQDVYRVPICPPGSGGDNGGVELMFQIRDAATVEAQAEAAAEGKKEDAPISPAGPSRKLQSALMMRNYLDNHDVLRQMQELLQDMVSQRPDDPIDYMINRLERVCQRTQDSDLCSDTVSKIVVDDDPPEKAEEASDADSGEDEEEGESAPVRRPAGRKRREGVSAEKATSDEDWKPPVHPKSPEERQQLKEIIMTSHDLKMHMLFGNVPKETLEQILDALFFKTVAVGEHVIQQGGVGDHFYIVKKGFFDIVVQKGEAPPKKVFEVGAGFAFGELALLYNAPRSATVTATEPSEVWCLDREAFRNLVLRSAEAQFKQYVEFLSGVDVLQVLRPHEVASLAEVLEEEEFGEDEAIIEQGERDNKMFILRAGEAVACIQGSEGEVEVMQYRQGDYFGEIALLSGEPRKASVYAVGSCTCLYITRETFMRILGPLQKLLERNIGKYEKYQDAIEHANHPEIDHQNFDEPVAESRTLESFRNDDQEEFEGGLSGCKKAKIVSRKRERPGEAMRKKLDSSKATRKESGNSEEPTSLAEKVALDFKNTALVSPTETFAASAKGSDLSIYGGLIMGQKYCDDKVVMVTHAPKGVETGTNAEYAWKATSKLKNHTDIAVVCQKGQKSAADPTPNQDNFFVRHIGGVSIYGVCDGHGPFGHLVSFRLVQSLPNFLARSSHYGKNWELALKEAFASAEQDLVEFCGTQEINIAASGATGSVLVLEEQTLHIAFIGDSRVMLGSWTKRDSRMIFITEDHKPEKSGERERLEAAGSEVREIDPGNFRIYQPGSNFPGLTMSRAFGDTACLGVTSEPEYHRHLMQPEDEWYVIIASDGIWEFLEGEEACALTAKKLRLKGARETLQFLATAARKRWEHCCGEYCDDITGILVMWNSHDHNDGKENHTLAVRKPR